MVVNVINKTLGKEYIKKTSDKEKTYREILYPYFQDHFFENLGISVIFGKKTDLKGEQLFLPAELQESIKNTPYNNQPICKENKTLLEFKTEATPFSWWNNFYVLALLLLIVIVANKNRIYMAYFFILGSLGLFLTFAGFYSLHKELLYNYNILLCNPALFLLIYFYSKNNKKGIYGVSIFGILSIAIYLVIMINKIHLLTVLPLILTSLVGLVKLTFQNKKKQI